MPKQVVKILSVTPLAARMNAYRVEKPAGYSFVPGQAAEVGVNKPGWESEFRPFTFTNLPSDPEIEFNIKCYPDHPGVTKLIHTLKPGDELLVGSSWGDLTYRGPGLFVAGGTGVTPFVSIFRDLEAKGLLTGNRLYWANAAHEDVFHEKELKQWLGGYSGVFGRAQSESIHKHYRAGDWVYLCGPSLFEDAIKADLIQRGVPADRIIQEE